MDYQGRRKPGLSRILQIASSAAELNGKRLVYSPLN